MADPVPAEAGRRKKRGPRVHPYAGELSTPAELRRDPRAITLFWAGIATALTLLGLAISSRFSDVLSAHGSPNWEAWTEVPLFGGLALLGFGFIERPWARRLTMAGWLIFAFYWALTAQDLFVAENGDYVNMAFALVGVYFFTYLAYHQWLSEARNTENQTVRFLNVATFVAAGAYFVIDKIEPVRRWLILTVSDHTAWMLNLFGQGPNQAVVSSDVSCPYNTPHPGGEGLVYCIDPLGSTSDDGATLTCFSYADHVGTTPAGDGDFWAKLMHFDPTGHDPTIVPVSIILACTALQSIMLFVGLFMGTQAPWRRRLVASVAVAAIVYVLNLLRNTGIVWFYGQGESSFWMMHDAIGKGGSLIAMVLIAFASFAWFPEFLKALIGVLDLPHRDGPVERTLRIGRRRPNLDAATSREPTEPSDNVPKVQ